jgi:hypothetical protein
MTFILLIVMIGLQGEFYLAILGAWCLGGVILGFFLLNKDKKPQIEANGLNEVRSELLDFYQ